MAETLQPAPPRQRPKPRRVEVARIQQLTPHMMRVTLTGQELAGFSSDMPSQHIKLFFPQPGQTAPVLPSPGPDGRPLYAEDQPRPSIRTYTPRRWDAATLELDVDFVLHGDGPATRWVAQARPGQQLAMGGPGGGYAVEPASSYVLAGDESALPALSTVLASLPAAASARAYIEVPDAADEQALESPAILESTWLARTPTGKRPGELLVDALRAADPPSGDTRFWVACEADSMRRIRRHLLEEAGVDKAHLYTRGYWKHGETDHSDHDTGETA